MKNLSRRMKRLLAILLVETIVAVNVISGYASESDGVYTISEAEVEAELQESGNEPAVTQEEGFDNSQDSYEESYEEQESSYQEQEIQQENQNVSEGEVGTSEEENADSEAQPVAEEPSLPEEENAEQTDEDTGEIIEEAKEEETADICTCGKACSTSEYDAACPVCSAAANLAEDAKEAFLKENCLKYMGQEEQETVEPETVEPEIVNKESNITIKGISVADGSIISGSPEFEIQVADEVTLSEQAPEITGYEFTGKAYVKTGDGDVEASGIKKETIETEKQEDGAVTQIIKETRLSFYDVNGETWTELTEDTTVAFEYKKLEEKVEEKVTVNFYAVCVDEDGNAIDGFEKTELTVSDSLDLTKAPVTIDGYNYVEASVDGVTAASLDKSKSTDEEGKETIVYSYTTADGKVEVTEDVTVTLSYEMTEEEKAAIHFYAESVDEKGNAIAGYEKKTLHFSDSMDLTAEPFAIEEYEYVEAAIDGTVVLSVDKATVEDEDGKETIAYSYTTADGSVEVSEDTTVTLTYKSVKEAAEVTLTWNYVDEEGLAIEGVEGEPEFEDTMVLHDAEKAPVAIEGYEYVEATIDGAVITAITKTAEDAETGAATEETEDAEPVYSYTYTTAAGESVAIEEDTEITLCYEETGIPVKVDATVVDEFGDEIGDKYTNMELPKFTDGELVLNDVENPPVARVQVRKSLFKVIKYTYVQATIDNKIITGFKREATAATADLKEKEQEFIYSYSTDNGATWTKLKEDTTVLFEYTDGRKTVYTYEDASVSVTATLQHANAIPDDAEFVVTAVMPSTSRYNYEAYMAALNANAAAISRDAVKSDNSEDGKAAFNEKNTLLYDIAFLAAPVDEEGNTIEGELVEYQPAEGSVNISISFKQKQLEEDLAAEKETDITVVHMPLSDSVKESVATTAEATGISASDVNVEVVSDSTSITGEKIDFNLSDFSAVAVYSASGVTAMKPGPATSYDKVLGEAANYGVVANEMNITGHMETNFAVWKLHGGAGVQASKNAGGGAGYTYIGNYDGNYFKMTSNNNEGYVKIYTTEEAMRRFGSDMTGLQSPDAPLGNLQFPDKVIIDYTSYSENDIKNKVSGMISSVAAQSSALKSAGDEHGYAYSEIVEKSIGNGDCKFGNDKPIIDIAKMGTEDNGTYYVNFEPGEFPQMAYTICLKAGQNVVFNIPDSEVYFGQYEVQIDGTSYVSDGYQPSDAMCERIIFNCPNAANVSTGKAEGTYIIPNADFKISEVSAGFLVANTISAIGGQEWHSTSKNIPVVNPTSFELTAAKTVDGAAPSTDENGKFTFTLYSVADDGTETVIETVRNNGGSIKFTRFNNIKQAGTYWYKIVESAEVDGYKIDNTIYYAKVIVSSVTNGLITDTNAKVVYYKNAKDGDEVGSAVFNNTTDRKIRIDGSKTWNDANNQDGKRPASITIRLRANGTEVASKTVTADDDWKWSFTDLPEKENGVSIVYTITEDPVENYETVVSGYDVTNSYTPENITINGSKTWNDANNQDGKRPESITIRLLANGTEVASKTVTAADRWTWSFDKDNNGNPLKKYENGKLIEYTIKEDAVEGYSTEYSADKLDVTNNYTPGKTSISVVKVWDDADNQDGKRPDSIEVQLKVGETVVGNTITLNEANKWSYTWSDLPEKRAGETIQYTVDEVSVPAGYTKTVEGNGTTGYRIINSYTPELTEIKVVKAWEDADDQDGIRPESVQAQLYADGVASGEAVTLNEANQWSYTWSDLAKKSNGHDIKYTVGEVKVPDGYELAVSGNAQNGYTLTNTHTPEKTSVSVVKVWDDANNQDGLRTEAIQVQLKAGDNSIGDEVTLNAANNWSYTWKDLDKKKAGVDIDYRVVEVEGPAGYQVSTSVDAAKNFTITNTHTPAVTSLSGTKVWDDVDNQDGIRPAKIIIKLLADGKEVAGRTLEVSSNGTNSWNWSFKDLPKYADGKEIEYTVEEIEVDGYTTSVEGNITEGITIRNTHKPETVEISGSKTWDDANNQDGKRPDSITINLLADGKPVDSKTVKAAADGSWNYSFTDLPKYANGNEIVYTVTEDAVKDYSTAIEGYNFKNSYTPSKTSITVTKAWVDANNQDGKRSSKIMVQLYADGNASGEPVELKESNNWTYIWSELPKMKAGQTIEYTVDEVDESGQSYTPGGYTKQITGDAEQGFIITNTHVPQTTSISGSKIWDDANNQDGKRPTSITVKLLEDGTVIKTTVVTPDTAGNWNYSFTDLPVYKNGQKITYTVEEEKVAGYVPSIDGTTITNRHIPETTSISGSKTWDDANNQDGRRPTKITVTLLANGVPTASKEVTADDNWQFGFEDLPKYADGEKITYTIQETTVSDYTTVITGDAANGFTITNSYTPGKTNVEGVKTWNDADDQDGKRPASITINLLADGVKVDSKTVTAQDGWKWNFTNLPEYKNGKKITYTITEDPVENYVIEVNGYNVINSHTPELVDFSGVKTWNDAENQDGKRPSSITIRLLANGEEVRTQEVTAANNWSWEFKGLPKYKDGKEIGYTITEDAVSGYTSTINGLDVTNTHTPETVDISGSKTWNDNDDQDGIRPDKITINLLADGKKIKSVTVGSADGWSWSFTGLPKYADGQEIHYTITEDVVKDYSSEITKTGDYEYKVVNSYTPGKTSKTVIKIWEDNNNQDGIRPTSIQVVLLANGQKADVADAEVTLNASNNWTYTWSDLDLKANKKTIKYTVQEIGTIEGYNTSYSEDTFTITNTHTPAKVYVEGTKTWEDNNNQDGIRPASIIVKLYADGELKDSKKVTAADGWSWKFDQLPKFKNVDGSAVKIQYSVQEEAVTGYDPTYPAGSFDIVNRHTLEKISLDGIKIWEDNNDQDGIRPDSVTMKLFADGKDTGKTAIASKADGWKYRFANLDKYKENGAEIKYTVEEVAVEGYEPTVNGTTVTNSHTPEKTSIEGTKVWNDADNQDGRRPERITIHLYADGREIASKTLTADTNQGNTWNWSFTDLDKKKDGKDIAYTVTEDEVMGYTTTISGTTITNTYKPEVTQISGTKIWLDNNNQDGKRPDSITILLLADGKIKLSTTTNAAANWEYSFADLPVYENGHKIIYTVEEIVPEGYKESYDGNNIMNQYDPEKTSVNGIKTWNDNDNQDGIRPQSITVHLYADGVDTGKKVTTDESRNWKYSFGDLDKYKDGVEIVYTVVEDQVKDYTTSIDGYNITNTHTPETIDVSGSKTWNDAGNQDKVRPDKITIRLYADGKEIQHREVTASENWKWSFTDLPKYADGKEIAYTISEDPVDDYTTEVKGYDVINTHKPAVVEIKGIKTWNDSDDQDGKRPTEIIVRLYADGTEVDNRTVTEKSGWIYRFTNLPKYAEDQQGHEIIYTVREDVVEGYSTEYTEDSYDITNSYTPEETSRTVTKIWEDGKNQDGLRPTSIMVQLMADKKPYGDPVELNESNNWTYTWTRLPVKEKKKEITYTVKEISKIEGYDTTCSDDTFIITNTHKPAEVFVEGTKTWDDNNNQDGKRPTSITINLLADGEKIDSMVVTPAADGTWSWRFDNLPKYKNVNGTVTKIQYSIEEIKVDGYESRKDYTNDRFNLINTHKPETVDLSGSKTWNDNDNADGSRPASIKISLLADGAVVAEKTVTEADGWSWSFKDLPKYADGKEIRYAVSEDVVDGYTPSYSEDGLSVINSYTPERTGRSVVKIWDDSNNADQIRPVSIQVQLFADGAAYGDVITLSDGNNWSYTWSDLPAKKNGQYISYTVQEITNVNGYTVSISESGTVFTIVNYHPVTPPPTPTPSDEPTPTPSTPGATPSAPTPTPPTGEVLGAKRCEGVLGARRGLDQAVLGKRRRPSTGDSAAMIIWVITLFGAMGGVVASIAGLKKKGDKK